MHNFWHPQNSNTLVIILLYLYNIFDLWILSLSWSWDPKKNILFWGFGHGKETVVLMGLDLDEYIHQWSNNFYCGKNELVVEGYP